MQKNSPSDSSPRFDPILASISAQCQLIEAARSDQGLDVLKPTISNLAKGAQSPP